MDYTNIKEYAKEKGVPIIRDESAHFLFELILKYKPKKILEIGTAIGYSGTLMLEGGDAHLTTIEKNQDSFVKAQENFENRGLTSRVRQILGDAKEILLQLEEEGQTYDFIFLDGPKGQYINYLPHLLNMLEKGGVLVADNVHLHGLVKGDEFVAHKHRAMVTKLRRFLQEITTDERLESEVFDIEDGISVSKKK